MIQYQQGFISIILQIVSKLHLRVWQIVVWYPIMSVQILENWHLMSPYLRFII